MHRSKFPGRLAIALGAAIIATTVNMAGPLEPPPGPVTSTGRFGPRTDVLALPGDATATRVISQPGSYYLSGNLTGEAGKNGIRIAANGVTLDLNGYSLNSGAAGSLDGIDAGISGRFKVTNGNIVGWGGNGIEADGGSLHVEDVHARGNSLWGISLGAHVQVVRCTAIENGAGGIEFATHGLVTQTVAQGNGGDGMSAIAGATFSDNVATVNNGAGIRCANDCLVRGNNVAFNSTPVDAPGSTVIENHP